MSKQAQAAQGSAAAAKSLTFKQMPVFGKILHIVKVTAFFATFGFAFSNILSDD